MNSSYDSRPDEAFESLHPGVQRWLWRKNWKELRDVQRKTIPLVLAGDRDVIVSASTAAGKTEAVFLPLATRILNISPHPPGFRVLLVSPLKALINDQYERLVDLLGSVKIPVHRQHGDVTQSERNKAMNNPAGVLLITPESLEAMFINRGHQLPAMFAPLLAVVVDELHSYIGSERGMQLQSLMHRVDLTLRRKVPRFGLSATLANMDLAGDALRPEGGYPREYVEAAGKGGSILLNILGFEHSLISDGDISIARSLFKTLRGDSHLIFANSRGKVERFSNLLREMCEKIHLPNEFWPHHGSLSKSLREDAERALKDSGLPATAICTSTLEMGIDIGGVESVAQLGCPPSVASLRQRLGRSGRRNGQSKVRMYIREDGLIECQHALDRLRLNLFQTVSMVILMGRGWIEPPEPHYPHLSTLVQQLLSLLAQWGEMTADEAFKLLCRGGPFHQVKEEMFDKFLRSLGAEKLIKQTQSFKLVLDEKGERMVNHYSFYAAFQTSRSFRLLYDGKTLGEIPVLYPLVENQALVFAGRRWLVLSVDIERSVVYLTPAYGGDPPSFDGGFSAKVHDEVRLEMKKLYMETIVPPFLDTTAKKFLAEGRATFSELGLVGDTLMDDGQDVVLFCWRGDKVLTTLVVWLASLDVACSQEISTISFSKSSVDEIRSLFARMVAEGPPDVRGLVGTVKGKHREKHHHFLTEELLAWEMTIGGMFDPQGAWQVVEGISKNSHIISLIPPDDSPPVLKKMAE